MARTLAEIHRKQHNKILRHRKHRKKTMATDNSEWKPFVYLDCYVKATPEGFACDYREVTHKIPPLHKWLDDRFFQTLCRELKVIHGDDPDVIDLIKKYEARLRSGVAIPEGDIMQEGYEETVDKSAANYEEWHKDYLHFKLQEIDKYSRDYCDSQNRKKKEEGKSPRYIGNTESINKRKLLKEFGSRDDSPTNPAANSDGGSEAKNESYNQKASKPLQKTAVTFEDDYGDIDF